MYLDEAGDEAPLNVTLAATVTVALLAIPVVDLGIFFQRAAEITQGLSIFGAP